MCRSVRVLCRRNYEVTCYYLMFMCAAFSSVDFQCVLQIIDS